MKITCIKDSKWQITGGIKNFVKDQDLEVGVDVSDKIAQDMLRCGYAIAKSGQPRIETKKEVIGTVAEKESKAFDIETANPNELEDFARKELGIELDKRVKVSKLRKQVRDAMKEKDNE